MGFLGAEVENDRQGLSTIDFETIKSARLDKLLTDITNKENRPDPAPSRFLDDEVFANKLQWLWTSRHQERFLTLEQERYRNLLQTGALRDMAFNDEEGTDFHSLWKAKEPKSHSKMGGEIDFEVGQYDNSRNSFDYQFVG